MLNEQELHAHTEAVDLAAFAPGGDLHITTPVKAVESDPAIIVKICAIYGTIRPYLESVATFPLVPAKVKTVIKAAITQLDKLCPGS